MHKQFTIKIFGIITAIVLLVICIFFAFQSLIPRTVTEMILMSFIALLVICFISIRIWDIRKSVGFLVGSNEDTEYRLAVVDSYGEIRTDKKGNIIYINEWAEKLTGWKRDEALNQPVENVYSVESEHGNENFINVATRVLADQVDVQEENNTILRSKDAFTYCISSYGKVLFDEEGNHSGALIGFKEVKNTDTEGRFSGSYDKNYWNLVEQASDAILISDTDGLLIKVNESFYKLLGYSIKEVQSMNVADLYCKTYLEHDPLQFDVIKRGKTLVRERSMLHKNGNTVSVEVNVKMIDGGRMLAIIRDIRERKIAEAALRRSNQRFELIGQATNDALWEWNLETGELWANEVHQQLYDLTLADPVPVQEEWKRRLHTDDREILLESIEEAMKSDKNTWSGEYRMQIHGEWAHIFGQTYIVRNSSGVPVMLMGNMTDITARKKAEEETRLAVERYDILARATSDTIWDWDVENNSMTYNDGIFYMFGYEAGVDNVIEWWNEKIHPDDHVKVSNKVSEIFETGQERFQLKYRFRCADGTYKHVFDRAFVLFNAAGKPYRVIGAMQDITYQVQEEARLGKAIMDAQEQERQYIGAELHDNVNQILAGALLVLGMVKENKTKLEEALAFVETGKGYINNAINEVRKLSHELAPASFDESKLKDAFENLLMAFNVDGRYEIRLNFDEQCNVMPEEIQINLYRILQEQLKNIVRHADATEIGISTAHIGSVVLLIISDNGKGFNLKTAKKGIGLGNIKKRASLLGGKCNIQSSEGQGCKISIEIPVDILPLQEKL